MHMPMQLLPRFFKKKITNNTEAPFMALLVSTIPHPPKETLLLRQEIDGLQAEQLEFVPCGQILQDRDNSRAREELSPAQIKDKETIYFSFSRSRRPSQLHMCRKAPWGSKREGAPPHSR